MSKKALGTASRYLCAGNLLWLNYAFSATPGIPYNRKSIMQLRQQLFGSAQDKLPETIVVGAASM